MTKNPNIKTDEGSTIKNMLDFCHGIFDSINFSITPEGIHCLDKNADGTMMVDIKLKSKQFNFFKCESMKFAINSANIPKIMKNIKKDDKIAIFATSDEKISFRVKDKKGDRKKLHDVPIQFFTSKLDEGAPDFGKLLPTVVVNAQDFQKACKTLNAIDKIVKIQAQEHSIMFQVNSPTIGLCAEYFGKWKKDDPVIFTLTLESKMLIDINKCSSLSKQKKLLLYAKPDLPFRINSNVGDLGEVDIYLTCKEDPSKM